MRLTAPIFALLVGLNGCSPTITLPKGAVVDASDNDAALEADAAMSAATPDAAVASDMTVPADWAVLTWSTPTMNTDGTPLTDLAGYFVYHGTTSPITTTNSDKIDVGNVNTYTFKNLAAGVHYFAVSTYNTEGVESAFSMTASKTVP